MDLTGDEIATTLIMERQTDPRLALVVEGEEECALIDIHLDFGKAKTQLSRSKTAVLKAAEILVSHGHEWAICIVDADFDRILGKDSLWPQNVVGSERYDLLMDAVASTPHNVEGVAVSHSQPGQVQAFYASEGMDVTSWVQRTIEPVGALRWQVVTGAYGFSVRDWSFAGMCSAGNEADRIARVASVAHQRSGLSVAVAQIQTSIAHHCASPPFDLALVHNGHDFLGALSELLRTRLGGRVGPRQVAATYRLALSCAEFQALALIRKVVDWAQTSHGIAILKCA